MGIEKAKTGYLLYHLTKLSNLDSIIENGMLPRRIIMEKNIGFGDIADLQIISKRRELGLDMYTPFHFHPYSAFDVAVKSNNNAQEMIYLCIDRRTAKFNEFKILPKHPLSEIECVLYDYDKGFNLIDWDTMMEKNRVDDYAKEVKMAECLTEKLIKINIISQIYVPTERVKENVEEKLRDAGIEFPPPKINILPIWFNY